MIPPRLTRASVAESALALLLLAYGGVRFLKSGLLPATQMLIGDFAAVFPTAYFARLRPDFPSQAWPGWSYGPMLHFVTLPLFLVPRWSMVPTVWALTNLAALTVSFVLACRLSGVTRQVSWAVLAALAGLWLLFQPLDACFASGNIEIIEMMLTLAALGALKTSRSRTAGVLIGVAAMLKFLPVGFLGWFVLREQWRAARAAVATIAVIVAITSVTLGWKGSALSTVGGGIIVAPQAGLHELSVTSLFLHRAGVLDYEAPTVRWFPSSRALVAARAGALASALLAAGFALLLLVRRRRPVSPAEIAVLFMTMFMILPWNHDYYYVFALVPLSVFFLQAAARRDWTLMAIIMAAYLMISPPVSFAWIDKTGWFSLPFAYVLNYHDIPLVGGLVLWFASTHQLLIEPQEGLAPRVPRWSTRRVVLVVLPVAAVIAVVFLWSGGTGTGSPASTITLSAPPPLRYAGGPALAVAPDASQMAYIAAGDILCTRRFDGPAAICWPETRDASGPFFSPSGRWVGFFQGGALKKVPAAGGPVAVIAEAIDANTGTWSYDPALPTLGRDGSIVFASADGIYQIAESRGEPDLLIPARPEEGLYAWPTLTPSGDTVLFTIAPRDGGLGAGTIWAQSLKTGRRARLLTGSQPHFDRQSGHLVYTRGGRVLAAAFSPETLTVSGVAVPVVSSVLVTLDGGAQFAVSDEGSVVYTPGSAVPTIRRRLLWVDRQGSEAALPIPANAFEGPRISPDGRAVAVAIRDVVTDVWLYGLAGGDPTRLTSTEAANSTPVWTPDGRAVAFTVEGPMVVSMPVGGAGGPSASLWTARAWESHEPVRLSSWARDGGLIAGTQRDDLWLLDTTKGSGHSVLIQTPFSERDPVFSPDGRWIAYSSDSSGTPEIYVRSYPGLGEPHRVTSDGTAVEPVWSKDGREIFYRRGDWMIAVSVTTGASFTAGPSRRLFEGKFARTGGPARDYDVASDGEHFLMVSREPEAESVPRGIRVLRHWSARLQQ